METPMYNPKEVRTPDTQYQETLKRVLFLGDYLEKTPQDTPVHMSFGTLPPLVFPIANGVPVITERKMGWRGPIGEMFAFVNGVQDFEVMKTEFGVPAPFWEPWVTERKTAKVGAKPGHLGDASYGPALAKYPRENGTTFDQFLHVVGQLCDSKLRERRTIYMHPWIPYQNGWGGLQKAVVSPCHGWMHFRVINDSLDMISWHRAADLPLGFPNDMIGYAALFIAIAHVTKLEPRNLVFQFGDAHIYKNQTELVQELLSREARILPELHIKAESLHKTDLKSFRSSDFELVDYDPHPAIRVPGSV